MTLEILTDSLVIRSDYNTQIADSKLKKLFPDYTYFIRIVSKGGLRFSLLAMKNKPLGSERGQILDFIEMRAKQKIQGRRSLPVIWFDLDPPKGWIGKELSIEDVIEHGTEKSTVTDQIN